MLPLPERKRATPAGIRGIVYDSDANTYAFDYEPLQFFLQQTGKRVRPDTGAVVNAVGYNLFQDIPVEPGVIYDARKGSGDLENAAYFAGPTYLGPFYNHPDYPDGSYSIAPRIPAGGSGPLVLRASSKSPAADQYVYATQLYNDKPLADRVTALEQGGGAGGTPRDPYDVDTAKRKEVVDANVPAYLETDTNYYGKSFVDEVYGPGQPAMYRCMPSAPAATGGATVWKWFRTDIL